MMPRMSRLLLLFFGFLALYAAGDWALPLIDRDEPRFAEASREMLERGDFIVPFCDNLPRYDKPPLIYWLQDGAYELLGENELAARLPSGLCGALATVIVAVWIGVNVWGLFNFDAYPFILLNLAFSLPAAYAAPLILLAYDAAPGSISGVWQVKILIPINAQGALQVSPLVNGVALTDSGLAVWVQ